MGLYFHVGRKVLTKREGMDNFPLLNIVGQLAQSSVSPAVQLVSRVGGTRP